MLLQLEYIVSGSCSHEPIQYGVIFPGRGKFKRAEMLACVLMWLGHRVGGSGDLFELKLSFNYFPHF